MTNPGYGVGLPFVLIKECYSCKIVKPLVEYNRRRGDQAASWCKECTKNYNVIWKAKNPDRYKELSRRMYMRKKYGFTNEDIENLPVECAICGADDYLHVDHDHNTGVVRGVLCRNCNWGLGNFKDDPVRLLNAIKYLEGVE